MRIDVLFTVTHVFVMCCKASETNKGPANSAILLKNNVTLQCKDESGSDIKPDWKFNAVGSTTPNTIYNNGHITNVDPRFSVDDRVDNHYDLMINTTDKTDAGSYYCQTSAGTYAAQLVILASNPVCEERQYMTGATNESYEVELNCSVQFWGNWPPTFRWQIINGSDLEASNVQSANNTLMSSVILPINSTDNDGIVVQCTTYFAERNWPGTMAKNVPRFHYIWTSRISSGKEVHEFETTTHDRRRNTYSDDRPGTMTIWKASTIVIILVVAFLFAFLAAFYFWKSCKDQKKNRRNANRDINNYAEISQIGSASVSSHLERNMLPSTGTRSYRGQYSYDGEIAAYAETMTIASLPVNAQDFKPFAPSVAETNMKMKSCPSVDSAMPVYAEVHKPSRGNPSNGLKQMGQQDHFRNPSKSLDGMATFEEIESASGDGTVYVKTKTAANVNKNKNKFPARKLPEQSLYASVDHRKPPPPPPPPF